jgi:hypothetical protein
MMYAYSWADGLIGFGNQIPEGALEIARHKNKNLLMEKVKLHASDDGRFIVSVRTAYLGITKENPVDCLINFGDYINKILAKRKSRAKAGED